MAEVLSEPVTQPVKGASKGNFSLSEYVYRSMGNKPEEADRQIRVGIPFEFCIIGSRRDSGRAG
jgi:hypothetical protein